MICEIEIKEVTYIVFFIIINLNKFYHDPRID